MKRELLIKMLKNLSGRLLVTVIMLTLITGCNQNSAKNKDGIIKVDISNVVSFINSGMIESIRLVELETSEESLVGPVFDVSLTDDGIFIIVAPSYTSSEGAILRFSREGAFLNKIGSYGRGPGEYQRINTISFNSLTRMIEVATSVNQILFYDLDGEYRGSFPNPNKIPIHSFARTKDGSYFVYGGANNGYDNNRLYLLSSGGELINSFFEEETTLGALVESNFTTYGNEIWFRETYNDTVYLLTGEGPEPVYIFDFGDKSLPDDFHTNSSGLFTTITDFGVIYDFRKGPEFILASIVLFGNDEQPSVNLIRSNRSGAVKVFGIDSSGYPLESLFNSYNVTDDGELLFLLYPSDLIRNPLRLEGLTVLHEALEPFMPVDENNNPFLAFVKLKDF